MVESYLACLQPLLYFHTNNIMEMCLLVCATVGIWSGERERLFGYGYDEEVREWERTYLGREEREEPQL